jgi:hypothetical protein
MTAVHTITTDLQSEQPVRRKSPSRAKTTPPIRPIAHGVRRAAEQQVGGVDQLVVTRIFVKALQASSAVAAPKNGENGPKITMPSTTPEGNRAGWFMAW